MTRVNKTRGPWFAAFAAVLALVLVAPSPASAAGEMTWWYVRKPSSRIVGDACSSTTRVGLQEHGLSGITRLKAKFERRGPNDPGIPGTSFETRGWYYSGYFPNDIQNYWMTFPAAFRHPIGGEYKIRAILVGERPSLWQRDIKFKVDLLPRIGCESGGGMFS